jgi:hypothetical protein
MPTGGANFQTWAAASAALSSGITGVGNTTFFVAPATFNEAVVFNPIIGTSSTSPITFTAAIGTATIDAGGAMNALTLNGLQSYLIFENIRLQNWTQYGLAMIGTRKEQRRQPRSTHSST